MSGLLKGKFDKRNPLYGKYFKKLCGDIEQSTYPA
jgi:hypothetical protein